MSKSGQDIQEGEDERSLKETGGVRGKPGLLGRRMIDSESLISCESCGRG